MFADVAEIGGVRFYLNGLLVSAGTDKTATGSAASVIGHELDRAYFELVERTSLLDAIDAPISKRPLLDAAGNGLGTCDRAQAFPTSPADATWAYARSNGVAAGPDWATACAAAQAEARERHYVLSAWYGYSIPTPHPLGDRTLHELRSLYDFEAHLFPAPPDDGIEPSVCVIGCFGFPKIDEAPFLAGFGAAPDVSCGRTASGPRNTTTARLSVGRVHPRRRTRVGAHSRLPPRAVFVAADARTGARVACRRARRPLWGVPRGLGPSSRLRRYHPRALGLTSQSREARNGCRPSFDLRARSPQGRLGRRAQRAPDCLTKPFETAALTCALVYSKSGCCGSGVSLPWAAGSAGGAVRFAVSCSGNCERRPVTSTSSPPSSVSRRTKR